LAKTEDMQFMYQSRFCLRGNEASSTCAVTMRCGSVVGEIYTTGEEVRIFMGHKEIRMPLLSTFSQQGLKLNRNSNLFEMSCSSGAHLTIYIKDDHGINYMDASLRLESDFIGKVSGLLGSWDGYIGNDIAFRDGRVWNPGHGLDYVNALEQPSLNDVQASWMITEQETLFSLPPRATNSECTHNRERQLLAAHSDAGQRADAEQACTKLGMTGMYLKTCMFDFIATSGSQKFLQNSADFVNRVRVVFED